MPIYEYRCGACGFQKESLQRLNDAPLTDCPECGKATFNKMVTAAGFQLKGSGWYATDFKNGQAKKAADKPDANAESKADAKADSKADSKADKADGKPAVKENTKPASDTAAKPAETPAAKPAPAATPATNT